MAGLIFHDPTGRRARRARLTGGLLTTLAAALAAGFFATLAFAPRLPGITLRDPHVLQAMHVETAPKLKGRADWTRIPHPKGQRADAPARPLSVGFYVSWDENARESLADNVNQLDVVSPQWIALKGTDGDLDITRDDQARA